MTNKNFNLIISGVGGQGLITLLKIITESALIDGHDVKSSELHGLSQRGGSVLAHIRFGAKIYSPMVSEGKADLIMSLELLEGLRYLGFGNKETNVLINRYSLPVLGGLKEEEILKSLSRLQGNRGSTTSSGPDKNLYLVEASKICKEKLQKEVISALYLLGYAVYKKLIPLKEESVLKAIEKLIPEKYLELNKKAFKLAKA
ncbi:MAG: indolepyruvate oxidoreductase subunit beta [Patescibacteria group bacterium]